MLPWQRFSLRSSSQNRSGDQRHFCLNHDQVFGVPSRGYLQDQEGTGIRRPRGLDPRVHDRTRDETLGFRPDTLLLRFTIRADKGLHLDAIPSGSNICMEEVELGMNGSYR